jgi:acetyl-CoA C-acetyltransferase
MEVVGALAAAHLGTPMSALEHTELYSCFPAAVRVQQRALGLGLDGVPTVTGGEAFAGGPWNNFVLQSTVAMIRLLRRDHHARGMVTSVSGFLNKPGLAVYSSEPGHLPLLVADLAKEAEQTTPTVVMAEDYRGPATVVAYTVSYERTADRTLVIADTPSGQRIVAYSTDAALAHRVTAQDLIGQAITVNGAEFTQP